VLQGGKKLVYTIQSSQCVAVCCRVLQGGKKSVHYSVFSVCCSVLQCVAGCCREVISRHTIQEILLQCMLQCMLQCVAVCCSVGGTKSAHYSRNSIYNEKSDDFSIFYPL